jgi:cytochrome c oxidase assembly factor CtaG
MSDEIESVFASWSPPAVLTIVVIGTACVYLRGWFKIRETRRAQFSGLRLSCFLLGIAALWLALASPLDDFADTSLSVHMAQHLILMSVVPPLILLGWPVVPLLRGLPAWILRHIVAPLLRFPALRRLGLWLILPVPAWFVMNATFLGWHVPRVYDFALQHEHWHQSEHACFLASSITFWWYIIRPWPTPRRRNGWAMLLFLLSADLVNTILSAFLAFCDRPIYTYYLTQPNPFHMSPLSDQILGAVIMWIIGSFVFLAPAILITFRLLQIPSGRFA